MIKVMVRGRAASIVKTNADQITSGSVGLKLYFSFDDEWTGLTKTAVFQNGSNSASVSIVNDECTVPANLIVTPGSYLEIGVIGTNGSTVTIRTVYASVLVYLGAKDGA